MLTFRQGLLSVATIAAAGCIAATAHSATIITLTPTYPGTISGVTPYTNKETIDFKFTIKAPYHFTFTATGSGGTFPFPISEMASGSSGTYVETYGEFPVHGSVDYTLTTAVPEPASWAMMIAGFGVVGAYTRRRLTRAVAA